MLRCFLVLLAASCAVSAAETMPPSDVLASGFADEDRDGLSDLEEIALGSDPAHPDTDGDGLTDGVESALGTDPSLVDTDRDGFLDGAEVSQYRDPIDASSVIYEGWPATPDLGAYRPTGDGC